MKKPKIVHVLADGSRTDSVAGKVIPADNAAYQVILSSRSAKRGENSMKRVCRGGILLVLMGISCADSSNIIPSVILLTSGMIMMGAQLCMQQQEL